MLAQCCTHAAPDAYIYANCVESHKALSKPETPHFSPLFLLPPLTLVLSLVLCGEKS